MRSFIIILLFCISLLGCKNRQEDAGSSKNDIQKEQKTQAGNYQISEKETYENESWNFSIEHPKDYLILESKISGKPVINFYAENTSYNPPFGIHEKADFPYIAILPEGLGVDGPSGNRKKISESDTAIFPDLPVDKNNSSAYLLKSGEAWAYFLRFQNPPEDWNQYSGIFIHFKVNNFKSNCFDKNGNKIPMDQCDPMGSDRVVLEGEIDNPSRTAIMQMLKSFKFKDVEKEKVSDKIKVENPLPNIEVNSPLKLKGQARGNWFFEATAPVQILDKDGKTLGESFVRTDENWMTSDFVSFSGTIKFDAPSDERGYVVFWRANPSGKPENKEFYKLPVIFPPKN